VRLGRLKGGICGMRISVISLGLRGICIELWRGLTLWLRTSTLLMKRSSLATCAIERTLVFRLYVRAPLSLPVTSTPRAQHVVLDADLHTLSILGTWPILSVYYYPPSAPEVSLWSLQYLLKGARRRRTGSGPGEGCARMPVGTYLYLHAVGAGNPVAVPGMAR
jgi:hypothetical protein